MSLFDWHDPFFDFDIDFHCPLCADHRFNVFRTDPFFTDFNQRFETMRLRHKQHFDMVKNRMRMHSNLFDHDSFFDDWPKWSDDFDRNFDFDWDRIKLNSGFPKISKDEKHVSIALDLPDYVEPNNINVTCTDREVIVKAEDKLQKGDTKTSYSYYYRSTMPENTDLKNAEAYLQPKSDKKNEVSINLPIKGAKHEAHVPTSTNEKEFQPILNTLRAPPPPSRGPDKIQLK